jgi:hypothetical protein
MMARLAALAAAAALPLIGTAHQVVPPTAIYVDAPTSSLVGRDYTVTVDDMRVPVTTVSRGPQLLSAIVLLDVSDSRRMGPVVEIRQLGGVAHPGDTVRIGTFADRVVIGSTAIVDGASAAQAEREVTQAGGASPLWDAICASVDALRGAGGLRVVVVFSDALPTANDRGFDETYDIAVHAGVMVSVIGIADEALRFSSQMQVIGRNDNLRRLARDTGGEYAELRTPMEEPTPVLVGQLHRLRARTRLEFLPPVRDGAVHRVSVALDGRPIGGPIWMRF